MTCSGSKNLPPAAAGPAMPPGWVGAARGGGLPRLGSAARPPGPAAPQDLVLASGYSGVGGSGYCAATGLG